MEKGREGVKEGEERRGREGRRKEGEGASRGIVSEKVAFRLPGTQHYTKRCCHRVLYAITETT